MFPYATATSHNKKEIHIRWIVRTGIQTPQRPIYARYHEEAELHGNDKVFREAEGAAM